MNMRIPEGLKAGHYLIRAEMIALHEGDVSYVANPRRGAQFYPDCVQIEVTGEGSVELPSEGVDFPGAYSYEDPGVVHNVRSLLFLFPIPFLPTNRFVGLLLHRNQARQNLHHTVRDRLHYSRPYRVERRMADNYFSKCRCAEWCDDACTLEHVDCEQCGDECYVCGCGEPDGGWDERVYGELECGV
jgi:hypothetical protein